MRLKKILNRWLKYILFNYLISKNYHIALIVFNYVMYYSIRFSRFIQELLSIKERKFFVKIKNQFNNNNIKELCRITLEFN